MKTYFLILFFISVLITIPHTFSTLYCYIKIAAEFHLGRRVEFDEPNAWKQSIIAGTLWAITLTLGILAITG